MLQICADPSPRLCPSLDWGVGGGLLTGLAVGVYPLNAAREKVRGSGEFLSAHSMQRWVIEGFWGQVEAIGPDNGT